MRKALVIVQFNNGSIGLAEEREEDHFVWVDGLPTQLADQFPAVSSEDLKDFLMEIAVAAVTMGREREPVKAKWPSFEFVKMLPPPPEGLSITRGTSIYI